MNEATHWQKVQVVLTTHHYLHVFMDSNDARHGKKKITPLWTSQLSFLKVENNSESLMGFLLKIGVGFSMFDARSLPSEHVVLHPF